MAKLCSQCNAQLEDGAVVCVHCGRSADEPLPISAEPPTPSGPTQDLPSAEPPAPMQPLFSAAARAADNDLSGIGGWLIFSAIGLAVSPFLFLRGIFADLRFLSGDGYQIYLAKHHALAALIVYEALNNTMLLIAAIVLNFLLYQKKRVFPTLMIIYLAAQFLLGLGDHLMAMRLGSHGDWTPVVKALLPAMVWIPYFLQSRRVKLTFVN